MVGHSTVDLFLADYWKVFNLIKHITKLTNLKEIGDKTNTSISERIFIGEKAISLPFECRRHLLWMVRTKLRLPSRNNITWSFISCPHQPHPCRIWRAFQNVYDLSTLLKYIVENAVAKQQSDPTFFTKFINQCKSNSLQVNGQKSKVLRFNSLKQNITVPDIPFPIVSSAIILGVIFTSDCSFKLHVDNIVQKGHYSTQSLRSMRRFGFSDRELLLAYSSYISPILEYCCSVWGPQAKNTAYIAAELEDVQKLATNINLGPSFSNYESAIELLNLPTLFDQRHELMMKFMESLLTNEKHQSASFSRHTMHYNKLEPVECHTNRFAKSYLPYFLSAFNKWIKSCAIFLKCSL